MTARRPTTQSLIADVPSSPGVYLFFDAQETLLYVGKSKSLRARVRSHFRDRSERWMMQRVRRIEVRRTAGELGALLLELQLIKELRPMYNVASKQKRRIILALRRKNVEGYHTVFLKAVDAVDPTRTDDLLSVFKHTTQAKEFLAGIARSHELCHKLLGLERTRGYCFGYHLNRCRGACCAEEPPDSYNKRLGVAFEERKIRSWPFKRGIAVEESSDGRSEMFLVESWCLMGALTRSDGTDEPFVTSNHRFDYDTYKILYGFIARPQNRVRVRDVGTREWKQLLGKFKPT